MILYKTNPPAGGGGAFKCHQCGETRDAAEVCQNCRSWKLAAFGAGIDRVAEEIINNFPTIKLFEINKEATPTNAKAQKVVEEFYENKGAVLLGTEMTFALLTKKISHSAIASLDSLFSIPDFRIREKIFRLILQTKNLAKEKFLIQTHNPEDATIIFAITGNLIEFYKKEIEDRAILNYPPFGIFIKIVTRGTKHFVTKETDNLKNILVNYSPTIFPSIHEKKGEPAATNTVIKLSRENWTEPNLLSLLKSLPPHFEIKVDPYNLI
jgi:primosomal protein N' (replication factor Y)